MPAIVSDDGSPERMSAGEDNGIGRRTESVVLRSQKVVTKPTKFRNDE